MVDYLKEYAQEKYSDEEYNEKIKNILLQSLSQRISFIQENF